VDEGQPRGGQLPSGGVTHMRRMREEDKWPNLRRCMLIQRWRQIKDGIRG
jgi:hypothetical protein